MDASIRELTAAPPDGVRHVYVPLAVVSTGAGAAGLVVLEDCRTLVPPDPPAPTDGRDGCDCCTICIGKDGDVPDLRRALGRLPNLAPGPATPVRLCLAPGDHELGDVRVIDRPNTVIVGCFPRSRLHIGQLPLRLAARGTGLEGVVVIGGAEPATVLLAASDITVRDNRFEIDRTQPLALLVEQGEELLIKDNEFFGAGIGITGKSRLVRITDNTITKFSRSAIEVDGRDRPGPIAITDNRLIDGLGSGIEALGVIEGLRIIGNQISQCRGEVQFLSKVVGGIVLDTVEDLLVRDNLVIGNGTDARGPSVGIYAARTAGVEISGNRIEGNGRAVVDGNPFAGGVLIDQLLPGSAAGAAADNHFGPALILTDNRIRTPRGQALAVFGRGDIRVQNNQMVTGIGTARGTGAQGVSARDMADVVLIGASGLDTLAGDLIAAAATGPRTPEVVARLAALFRTPVPGRVALHGNQIALEVHNSGPNDRPPLSAVAVFGFDDVDLSHNQIDLALRPGVPFCLDAFIVATTTRQIGNRVSEPVGTCLASLLSIAAALNTCGQNQGTHCILASGPRSAVAFNLVLNPSILCPNG